MTSNLASFNAQIDEYVKSIAPKQLVPLQKKIALEALRRIVKKTPADTGRTRGSWQVTIALPAAGDKRSTSPVQDGIAALAELRGFEVVYISSNVPYILVLEEGGFVPASPGPSKDPRKGRKGRVLVEGGYSVQAPHGMVAVTIEELSEIFNKAA